MKAFCLILSFSVLGIAQPIISVGAPSFRIHDLHMQPSNPGFGHISPVMGHDNWNHYNGGLWHGPHYDNGGTPWGWHAGYGWNSWPAGVPMGAPIAVAPINCGC